MAVGDSAIITSLSYLAIGRETTFKSYNTAAAALDVLSTSFKTMKENQILEEITSKRTYGKRIGLMKTIEASIEAYAYSESTALAYIMENAFGSDIVSATATGETAGGSAFTHTFSIGNFDESYTSLCVNHRKGDSSNGFVYEYSGIRVNELSFSAEIDDALKFNSSLMIVDSTQTSNDVSSVLSTLEHEPLSFVNGRVSVVAGTLGAITTTAYWHIQSFELAMNNSIKGDTDSGRIGSEVLDVLPPGIASFTFNATLRFNTLTAYNAMLNETKMAAEIEFTGETLGTSVIPRGLKFKLPELYISDAGDPEVSGPDGVLTSEVVFHVLRDESSSSGYALQAELTNDVSTYA